MLIEAEELKTWLNSEIKTIDNLNYKPYGQHADYCAGNRMGFKKVINKIAELEQKQTVCKHRYHPYCKSHGFIIDVLSCKDDCGNFQLFCKICFVENPVRAAEQKHERD